MARKAILETYYTFTPSTRTIVIPRAIPKERLVLITDTTTNQVIFNFSDPNLTTTSYTIATDPTGQFTTTTITLAYNTTALSATDKLQIIIDEYDEKFSPSETYLDPISKLRVSTPQSLIDTDYEYSTQQTKWEQLAMINNRPFAYFNTISPLTVLDIRANSGSKIYTGYTSNTPAPAIGQPITILDTIYGGADGTYIVDSNNNPSLTNITGTANTFTYTGRYYYSANNQSSNSSILNYGVTSTYTANIFSQANIGLSSITQTGNYAIVTTNTSHGLVPGNEFAISGLTGTLAPNGSFQVAQVISQNTFAFWANYANTGSPYIYNNTNFNPETKQIYGTAQLYARPLGFAVHRSFDGGVRFSTNSGSHNSQYVRQTRRYFRYQSGKGIQMSTGTILKPQFNLESITANGTTINVTTKDPHNIFATMFINVSGANETPYNGTFPVTNVLSPYTFQYTANSVPLNPVASGITYASAQSWYGGGTRIGIFDSQNGMFFEFDGQTLYAVKRSSTFQINGTISANPNSDIITGNSTYFNKQLNVNDFIVIKGMSYRVNNILSDTQLQIVPAFRGNVPIQYAQMSKTVEQRVPQSAWNIDRGDGTGPSGYNIDLTKMQMFYIDYSWYGAGFVRFGWRGADGNVYYCHKMVNNNVNYLAYMRSGNLPGRYECHTFSKTTYLIGGGTNGVWNTFLPTDTVLYANTTVGFPNSGTILVRTANNAAGGGNAAFEYINYNGITSNSFINLTRGQPGNTAGIYISSNIGNTQLTLQGGQSTSGLQIGQYLYGANIATGAFISSFTANTIIMNYAAIGNNSVTVPQPVFALPLGNVAQTFSFSTTAQTAIELHAPQFSTEINHWGTSAIMDGGFTPDKSFIFTRGQTGNTIVQPQATQAIMSFRIAPSVSNGIANTYLGVREIVNRMQQLPFEADIYSNGSFLITCYLNAKSNNLNEQWQNVGGSSLSQYIFHNQGTTVSGGEPVFGFYLNTNQGTYATTQQDLTQLLALGTSILSGGSANAGINVYPDGPDVLTFVGTNIDFAARSIQARYSWNEAQA